MRIWRLVCALMLALAGAAQADVWDVGADTDNNSGTDNELAHGSRQTHDLGALPGPLPDEDWYRWYGGADVLGGAGRRRDGRHLRRRRLRVVILQMYAADGVTAEYNGLGVSSFNCTRSINTTNADVRTPNDIGSHHFVRVKAVDCTANCDANDQYTIRARETTLYVPRFNNSATQVTVSAYLQNTDDQPAEAQFSFLVLPVRA